VVGSSIFLLTRGTKHDMQVAAGKYRFSFFSHTYP